MTWVTVVGLLGAVLAVNCEKHSLYYIYTAFSKPVELPGIHEFTAMGQLDGRMIDYFDNDHPVKIAKQDWMKAKLPDDYWEKGTQSRLSKQQWFKVNIDILMNRMRQNNSDTHVLQWMHGCEGEMINDKLMFIRGMDKYSYDGKDFLSFDDAHEVWVAPTDEALQTKRKWDEVKVLKEYTKGYLENECLDWLNKFRLYGQKQLKEAKAPEVHVFAKNTKNPENVVLTCLATGFYPKDIILQIIRNGRVLQKEDGLQTSGVRPNDDDTFQRRDWVEILRSDLSEYRCLVNHPASGKYVEKIWDRVLAPPGCEEGLGLLIGVIAGIMALIVGVAVVLVVLYQKGILGCGKKGSQGTTIYAVPVPLGTTSPPPSAPVLQCTIPVATQANGNTAPKGSHQSLNSDSSGIDSDSDSGEETPVLIDGSNKSVRSNSSGIATNEPSRDATPEAQHLLGEENEG